MLRRVADELLAVLIPPLCLAWLGTPRCPRCALPAPCGGRCPATGAPFAAAWAPLAHEGTARALVAALKFRRRLAVADLMAAQIAAGAPSELLGPGAVLVPVPAHPQRRRSRGFDQADRLARALARRTGLPRRSVLRRAPSGARQAVG